MKRLAIRAKTCHCYFLKLFLSSSNTEALAHPSNRPLLETIWVEKKDIWNACFMLIVLRWTIQTRIGVIVVGAFGQRNLEQKTGEFNFSALQKNCKSWVESGRVQERRQDRFASLEDGMLQVTRCSCNAILTAVRLSLQFALENRQYGRPKRLNYMLHWWCVCFECRPLGLPCMK